jgi:hypothetical protein
MDIRNRKAGNQAGRRTLLAALTLGLMLATGTVASASAQEPQQQNQQQPPAQDPQQAPPQSQDQTPDQSQPPASANRPVTPPVAKAKPRYASQDANSPVYAGDGKNQSPYSAPPPSQQQPSLNKHQDGPDAQDPGNPPDAQQDPNAPQDSQQAPPPPPYRDRGYRNRPPQDNRDEDNGGYAQSQPARPTAPLPSTLTIPAGTVLSVRVNEFLSSDKNQIGDRVTATLERPIVVNGWVVARRGQTLTGQVTAATKAGRIKGTSQLGLELTDLSLVDGANAPLLTEIWKGSGGTSHGADAAAIGGTTALGAAIGSVADWGRGAAIGAGAGAAAGIGAVLLTRGRPTEILPETPMTFRLVDPVKVDTTQSAQSFAPVTQQDYDNGGRGGRGGRRYASGPYGYAGAYAYPAYGYPVYPAYGYGPYAYPYPGYVTFYGGYGRRGWRR